MSLKQTLSNIPVSATQLKIETGSAGVSYGASTIAAFGGVWTKNEIMAAGGLIFVAATYFTSLYFQRRRDRREQQLLEHRMMLEQERQHTRGNE